MIVGAVLCLLSRRGALKVVCHLLIAYRDREYTSLDHVPLYYFGVCDRNRGYCVPWSGHCA